MSDTHPASAMAIGDRLDIHDLYARQSHFVDNGDGDGWAATFTEQGTFLSPTYKLKAEGTSELKAFAEESNQAALAGGRQFRHVVSTIVLSPIDDDHVTSRAYLMILATSDGGTLVDRSVVLNDRLRRVDGTWLFESREVFRDH